MKTLRNIILGIIFIVALVSCDNLVSLGSKLDLDGPDVIFTSPVPRKAVTSNFVLEGTAEDKSGVMILLVKVEKDRVELPRQWRYSKGVWEISDNYGASWSLLPGAVWEGDKSVVWSIPIDMFFNGQQAQDGEYMFSAQAWDKGSVTDDNSFKTLIIIVDNDPPKVSVVNPLMFSRYLTYNTVTDEFNDTELEYLRSMPDWRNPEYIGKFLTNSFQLQWIIDDNFNIWSFDLRFYEMDVPIDNVIDTPLPDNYIYSYHENLPPVPVSPSPGEYLNPNGSVTVPALDGEIKSYGENGELKKLITDKTVIRVVAVCYDAASNVTQEKTIGYFIYWPQADIPWITFSGDIKAPEYYINLPAPGGPYSSNVEEAFLVYPGRDIKAVAFHAQGVDKVIYSLYKLEPAGTLGASAQTLLPDYVNLEKENPIRGETNNKSTSFSWDFRPPPRSAFYIAKAEAVSVSGKRSEPVSVVFKVQDISFPDFPKSVQPPALEPLFKYISSDSITISGIVSDATQIDTLCLVWINPESLNFAKQAQLEYFRDSGYKGWQTALTLSPGGAYSLQDDYDSTNPNKVWKLAPSLNTALPNDSFGINPESQRVEYNFSKVIPLSDLNIGIGKQPLKSQVFLLRAENPDNRVTIITYTPQGDENLPDIKITNVVVTHTDSSKSELIPRQFGQIDKFKTGEIITINGTWGEDSVEYLPFNAYLKENFLISINQNELPPGKLSFTGVDYQDSGTWKAEVTVGTDILLANLKDTLVVAAQVSDIGGNQLDDGASWLIESDTLRLVRISSEDADQTYNVGKTIEIFIEFNKPVRLKNGGNPALTLNLTGGVTTIATYKAGQNNQNTKQYFTYTVQTGQRTTDNSWLDVIGLNAAGDSSLATYPFTWVSGAEEIRVTTNVTHIEGTTSGGILYRRLPVKANADDEMYTLAKGKNIGIDTVAPTVQRIGSSNKAGHYALGADIDVDIVFNEAVKFADDSTPPQLRLSLANGATVTTSGTPKVNNDTITFTYKVVSGNTTENNKVIVNSFTGGGITDIAGTTMAAMTLTEPQRSLNGGKSNDGTGIYINTIAPSAPTFKALYANNNSSVISNNLGTANSSGGAADLKNVYNDELWFAIEPSGVTAGINYRVGYLEYSLDGTNWKRIDSITGAPFKQDVYGSYSVRVRQTDKAGNVSSVSAAVTLNWDPGALVTRIDSTSANGTYTNNSSRQDHINITVYFRKTLTFTGTQTITLNAIRGAGTTRVTVTTPAVITDKLSFDYAVANNDNTPTGTERTPYLDVYAFTTINATDAQGVTVSSLITKPVDNNNNLGYRKDIQVVTGALSLSAGPTYAITAANDEASGTITLSFNRSISKRAGDITVTQQTAGYRLPAVLTETQANRYKSIASFNDYYTRGTNGFVGGAVDTSTKYVLNYSQTSVVNPANTTGAAKLAYDFLQAEKITLPVSSQDVTVSGDTLTINLTGSNTLQVLGAVYEIVLPAGLLQDSLGFQWPASATTYNHTTAGINRPFVRVDKKINADRITAATGSAYMPSLMADFSNLIQTTARFDCRTPDSIVRYAYTGQAHAATAATTSYNRAGENWRNGDSLALATLNDADKLEFLTQQALTETGTAGTLGAGTELTGSGYANAATSLTVGTAATNAGTATENVSGFLWRISIRSRNGTTGNINSDLYEEMAFRTVLTYQLENFSGNTLGQNLSNGDQLWIRGGDAIGSSTVAGFPINWQDDYSKLNTEKKRAGARLLRRVSSNNSLTGTNFNTASVWRWITWEINVRTWHDVVLANGDATAAAGDTAKANHAWQYGPRFWAYQRGGWTALKDDYTLYPGKHRWVRLTNDDSYNPGGRVNFSFQFSVRGDQSAVTLTQPSP